MAKGKMSKGRKAREAAKKQNSANAKKRQIYA